MPIPDEAPATPELREWSTETEFARECVIGTAVSRPFEFVRFQEEVLDLIAHAQADQRELAKRKNAEPPPRTGWFSWVPAWAYVAMAMAPSSVWGIACLLHEVGVR